MHLLSVDRSKYNFIEADDKNFRYMGRIDFSDKKAPTFIYAGSMICAKFEGTCIKIAIKNKHQCYENYIGYVLDGKIYGQVYITRNDKKVIINIMSGLKNAVHEIILFKRQDACHYFDFYGLILDKGCKILKSEPKNKKRIECFGDSIAVGELSENKINMDKKQLESYKAKLSNAAYSFPMILARYLKAEVNNNSQGGLALLNNNGFFRRERNLGLEFTYDKLRYNPELGECTKWDFSKYIPHVVIMEFGHFDSNKNNNIHIWKEKYKEILVDLRNKYPKALFILISSILRHNMIFDDAMDEIVKEMSDNKICRYKFIRNGDGPLEYLSISQQSEMAEELMEFINSFGDKIWT